MKITITITLAILTSSFAICQQVPDLEFKPVIKKAAYSSHTGPVVLIDEAHNNFHTIDNRFKPFSRLLERDGYRLKGGSSSFSKTALDGVRILVIANALHESNTANWSLPNPSAFTDEEITLVQTWVKNGGSLFLIADHMPFPGCNEKLAAAFGFTFYNGFAMDTTDHKGPDLFSVHNKRLATTLVTEGLDSIYSFTGQAFDIPAEATSLLTLDKDFEIWLPRVAWQFDTETTKSSGNKKVQIAILDYGKGRVAVSGEAAMFTAQLAGATGNRVGFNSPIAKRNADFLLRIIHWLDHQ